MRETYYLTLKKRYNNVTYIGGKMKTYKTRQVDLSTIQLITLDFVIKELQDLRKRRQQTLERVKRYRKKQEKKNARS